VGAVKEGIYFFFASQERGRSFFFTIPALNKPPTYENQDKRQGVNVTLIYNPSNIFARAPLV